MTHYHSEELSSKRRSLVDLRLKQMKFDAMILSSDGKHLKVSLSRSRGQRSLPKEAVIAGHGWGSVERQVGSPKSKFTTIGSLNFSR